MQKIIFWSLKNLSLSFKNIKRYLTGEEKILTLSFKNITLSFKILTLSFFGLVFVNPVFADTIKSSVSIKPSMSLEIPASTVSLTLDPGSNPFAFQEINLTVGTNNKNGYWLAITSASGNSDLVNTNDDTKTIPTLTQAGDYDSSNFEINKWGYKIGTGSFNPFVSGNPIIESDAAVNGEVIKITLASKIDYLQASGVYSTTLNIKALPIMTTNYMQNLPADLCTEDPSVVIDRRDEQAYTIQRLKDGKCWMMTNLNLGATPLTQDLTSSNTNLNSTITASTFNSWKKTSGTSTYTAAEYIQLPGSDSYNHMPYGTLYNYCATSAKTICSSSNSGSAKYDICPAGWRLPTGGSSGEFRTLYNNTNYNSNAKMRAPIISGGVALPLAGIFGNTTPTDQGGSGGYWSSTRLDSVFMYRLYLRTSGVDPTSDGNRKYGLSIRCILK